MPRAWFPTLCLALLLPAGAAAQAADTLDILRPGDVMQIRFWPDQLPSGEYRVQASGRVIVPFAGELTVAGRPLDGVASEISRRYAETTMNGTVSITVLFRVSVLGAVLRPGLYTADSSLTLLDVIGLAGGFAPEADLASIRVLRGGTALVADARGLREGRLDQLGISIRSGDQIIVSPKKPPGIRGQTILTIVQTVAAITAVILQLSKP